MNRLKNHILSFYKHNRLGSARRLITLFITVALSRDVNKQYAQVIKRSRDGRNHLLGKVLLPFLIPLFIFTGCQNDPPAPLPRLGTASKPLTYDKFEDVAGLFQQQSDTTYVINFWATWCKPCREELPLLNQLAQEEQGKKVKVVLISLDTEASAIKRIPAFLAKTAPDLSSIILTDEDQAWGKTIDRVWSGSLPTTIIYRKDLRYVYRRGFNTYLDVEAALKPLLEK